MESWTREELLLGYLLNALDHSETCQVEQMLDQDAECRRCLELLRLALVPVGSGLEHLDPPADLARSVCETIRNKLAADL